MKHEDGVEGAEFGAHDAEVETDDDGVKYDSKFQDEEGGDLLLERELAGICVTKFELFRETFFVVICRGSTVGLGCLTRRSGILPIYNARDSRLDILLRAHVVFDLNIALGSKVEQKDHHDRHEHDSRTPRVLRPVSRHTHTSIGAYLAVRWIEEMYESGSNDDASAEVAGEDVDVERDAESWGSFGDDGEEGGAGGNDHDNEKGRDSGAEMAVVCIGGGGDGADDIARVGGCEVDV